MITLLNPYISSALPMVLHTLYLQFDKKSTLVSYRRLEVMIRCEFLQTSGLFEEVDLSSYCIGISLNGPETIYSIGFVKTNNDEY